MKRLPKQISGTDNRIFVIADDHTIWELNHAGEWDRHPDLPSKEEWPSDQIDKPRPKVYDRSQL